uniref:AT-hook motif nuclear-localized protein n=1 Tax=Aegilops tauschii TaxID=37682 RepID=M8AV29_AEGTA
MPLASTPWRARRRAGGNERPRTSPPLAMYRPDPPRRASPQPVGGGGGARVVSVSGSGSGGELVKKKRGRPRKYGPDGTMGSAVKAEAGGQSGGAGSNSNPDGKRRGRPPGSGKKKQLDALGSAGTSFTPHIITVKPNEDVASKIMSFSQQGPRTTCIISANGALCTATLRQPATSGGIVTYEGHFDILSLSGSFLLAEDGDTRSRTGGLSVALAGSDGRIGHFDILSLSGSFLLAEDGDTRSRTGGLSVALAGSDGRIVGGCVAGMLMAATPVQVVVGSFIAEGNKKPKEEQPKREPTSVPMLTSAPMQTAAGFGAASAAATPSDGTSSDHSDDPGSPMGPNGSAFNNAGHPTHASYAPVGWSISGNQGRYDPDMKMVTD